MSETWKVVVQKLREQFPVSNISSGTLVALPVGRHVRDEVFLNDCVRRGYNTDTTLEDVEKTLHLFFRGHEVPLVPNMRANYFFVRDIEGRLRPVAVFVDKKREACDIRVYREKSKGGLSLGAHVMVLKGE